MWFIGLPFSLLICSFLFAAEQDGCGDDQTIVTSNTSIFKNGDTTERTCCLSDFHVKGMLSPQALQGLSDSQACSITVQNITVHGNVNIKPQVGYEYNRVKNSGLKDLADPGLSECFFCIYQFCMYTNNPVKKYTGLPYLLENPGNIKNILNDLKSPKISSILSSNLKIYVQ